MPAQKKQVKKTETSETHKPKTFNAYVTSIGERNDLVLSKDTQTERVVIAHIDIPRYDKKENREEIFAYECGEFLRKKLIGKEVKFETVTEEPVKTVVPIIGGENIVATLLSLGFAAIRDARGRMNEAYVEAEDLAKKEKRGIWSENPEKLCKKRPAEPRMTAKDLNFYLNKTMKGFIKRVEAPGSFIIEAEDRKFVRVLLFGIHQHAPFDMDKNTYKLDEMAKEAMKFVERNFGMRDCQVKILENGKKVRATVVVNGKDVAEHLLLNGYVSVAINPDSELKAAYEAATEKAQAEKKGRYANEEVLKAEREKKEKMEKAVNDRLTNAKVISGWIKNIGRTLKMEKEDGTEVSISLASVRPLYKKDDANFNKNVEMRMRECIRKQIAGKKVEAKLAYTQTFKRDDKEVSEDRYDVYANGKNIALALLREGIVSLDNSKADTFKQSFDFKALKEVQKRDFKVVPVTEYTPATIDKIKDYFIEQRDFTCAIEKVISLTKYAIYIPSKESLLTINIKNVRTPKGEAAKEFIDKARDVITKLIQYQDATVVFDHFSKGIMYADVIIKGVGSVQEYLINKGYAIPTGKVVLSQEVEEMKQNKTQIYAFDVEVEKKETKEEEVKKPKRINEVKFGQEEMVYMTGFDGENIYYYITKEETAFIEALSAEIKSIKRGKYELALGKGYAVDIKGTMYRAEVLSLNNGANVVRCVDTGITTVVGKAKIRAIPEEIANREVKVLSKKLIGIKPLRVKDQCYKAMLEAPQQFFGNVVAMSVCSDEAKIVLGDVCLNVFLVAQGLALVDKKFFDKGEFGTALRDSQAKAKENHLNAWQFGEIFDDDEKQRD